MSSWFFSPQKAATPPSQQPTRRAPAESLLHYQPGGATPPSARVDHKLKLQPRRALRLWDYLKIWPIMAAKATEVSSEVLRHHIWGPRRKTWGIEMTILTTLMRAADRHSAFVDIGTVRMFTSIAGLVPLPSDALVTPVTFRVKRRGLRGILADFDAKEDGSRELSGEWVVGRKTWQRMQTEWKAASKSEASGSASTPLAGDAAASGGRKAAPKKKELVVLYIHGGAYWLSSAAVQRIISIPLAKYTDSRVFAIDYRLAPETPFPGPLHDCVLAYLRLIEDLNIPPENIIFSGDSAGGGLTLALLLYLRDNAYPLPSGAILMSPWVDLTMSCESWETNAMYDVIPCPQADNHMNPIAMYLGEQTEEYLTHPYASPLFGDFKGLPPLLIQAGDCEVLRDEISLLAHKAADAGVQVLHELYDDAIHVFQAYPFLDASRRSFESMRNFVRIILPQYQTRSPQLLAATTELGLEREIETDQAVVVGGDGAEHSTAADKHAEVERFGLKEKKTAQESSGESSDDEPSWVRTPQAEWPDMGDADIPDLNLSPSLGVSGTTRSSVPGSPNRPRSPRRIQSTSSLAAQVARHFKHAQETAHSPTSHDSPPDSPPHHSNFLFASSPASSTLTLGRRAPHARMHNRSKSSNYVAPLTLSTAVLQPQLQPPSPLVSPSARKRRQSIGLAPSRKRSMRFKDSTNVTAEGTVIN